MAFVSQQKYLQLASFCMGAQSDNAPSLISNSNLNSSHPLYMTGFPAVWIEHPLSRLDKSLKKKKRNANAQFGIFSLSLSSQWNTLVLFLLLFQPICFILKYVAVQPPSRHTRGDLKFGVCACLWNSFADKQEHSVLPDWEVFEVCILFSDEIMACVCACVGEGRSIVTHC